MLLALDGKIMRPFTIASSVRLLRSGESLALDRRRGGESAQSPRAEEKNASARTHHQITLANSVVPQLHIVGVLRVGHVLVLRIEGIQREEVPEGGAQEGGEEPED